MCIIKKFSQIVIYMKKKFELSLKTCLFTIQINHLTDSESDVGSLTNESTKRIQTINSNLVEGKMA